MLKTTGQISSNLSWLSVLSDQPPQNLNNNLCGLTRLSRVVFTWGSLMGLPCDGRWGRLHLKGVAGLDTASSLTCLVALALGFSVPPCGFISGPLLLAWASPGTVVSGSFISAWQLAPKRQEVEIVGPDKGHSVLSTMSFPLYYFGQRGHRAQSDLRRWSTASPADERAAKPQCREQ